MKKLLLIPLLALVTGTALANTLYVTDQLSAPLRRGQGTQYRIVGSVQSGQKVQVLDHDAQTGYTKVSTPGGKTGWILTRFLSQTPSAREQLSQAQSKVSQLQQQNQTLKKKLGSLQSDKSTLSAKRSNLEAQNSQLKQRLSSISNEASHAIQISHANQQLKAKVASLQSDRSRLQSQNNALRSQHRGMEVGAFILLLGIVLGLIIPRLRFKRRSAWDRY